MRKLLTIIPLVFLLCFTFACQNKAEKAELEKFRAKAAVEEQNEVLARSVYEELSKRNLDAYINMWSSDIAYFGPSGSAKSLSPEEHRGMVESVLLAFPDFNANVQDLIAKKDKVTARWILKATHEGEWQGIPATGNRVEVSVLTIFRFQDGKIVDIWEEGDQLGWMQQLGMELKPKEGEK